VRPRGVAQNSALALAGDLAAKGGMLAVMMVAARGLPTVQFAMLATAIAIATVLTAALDLGSQTLLTRDGVDGPAARGSLLHALALARTPMLATALAIAVVVGVAMGHPLEATATVLIAAAGAAQLSLTGALRSAQDLAPEAVAKLLAGVLMLVAAGLCVAFVPRAGAMLLALTVASSLSLAPLVRSVRLVARRGAPPRPWGTLRRAAPLGAMALATLAYYRSGTIALSLLSTARETALFAAASTLAWGLLCVANAVTTGLLPRLAAANSSADLAEVTRRALVWTTGFAMILAALVAALATPLLVLVFGARYGDATRPLMLLVGATVLIAPAGVLGTALVAVGRLLPLCIQVGCSLLVNLVALLLLVPVAGAVGAAGATLACETVALVLLTRAALQALPGILPWPPRRVRALSATFAAKPGR
jgi:O-antigen/teichoic acid export membrane protein